MNANTPLADPLAEYSIFAETDREEWMTLQGLAVRLREVEQRLGTPRELTQDEADARELGHDIRNRLNTLQLRQEFRELMLAKAARLQQTA